MLFFNKKKKSENENPLHTEYGVIKNTVFLLKKIKKYSPKLLVLLLAGVLAGSALQFLYSFIGKFVIDIVEVQATSADKDLAPLIKLLIITTVLDFICMTMNAIANNRVWYSFIHVRMCVIKERIDKVLSMNYQMLEQPKILDMHQKALQAAGGNEQGVEGMMRTLYQMAIRATVIGVTFSAILVLDMRLILVLLLVSFIQSAFFRHTVKRDRKEVWDVLPPTWRKQEYMEQTTQNFDYAKDIRLFGMKHWLSKKQHEINKEQADKMCHSRNLWVYNTIFAHGMQVIVQAVVYGVLIYAVLDKNMSIGNFTLFVGLATSFSENMNDLLSLRGSIKEKSMQVDDHRSFMDLVMDNEDECIPIPETDSYTFEFKNVSFQYEGAETYAIKNLNLTLSYGKKLAVVGLNGAGKTTFIKLLLRLYDVTEGEILLNGINIKRFKRKEYYELFAPVFQEVFLFAFPMDENVSMQNPQDTDSDKAYQCLLQAGLEEKILSLEKGVHKELLKVIHDDGVDLSGGEKQKLALARALYKDAPVIVLDEPTAALDALAEYHLYQNFDEMIGNKTAIYISHRLSSTRFCDNIAMFVAGEMVEYGTHDSLLSKGGEYAGMFEVQAQYYKEKEGETYEED